MKYIVVFFLSTFFCQPNAADKKLIEVYLIKKSINPTANAKIPENVFNHFSVTKSDLKEFPLIVDSEIIEYDTSLFKIRFSKQAADKISALTPPINSGIQFAITVDKEPIICGYFVNRNTSQPVLSYMLFASNDTLQHIDKLILNETDDLRKNKTLVNAFIESGRIAKKY